MNFYINLLCRIQKGKENGCKPEGLLKKESTVIVGKGASKSEQTVTEKYYCGLCGKFSDSKGWTEKRFGGKQALERLEMTTAHLFCVCTKVRDQNAIY